MKILIPSQLHLGLDIQPSDIDGTHRIGNKIKRVRKVEQ